MDWLDFYNVYVAGCIQILAGFHFFTRCLQKRTKFPLYVMFTVLEMAAALFLPEGNAVELAVYILLLAAVGIFVYRASCPGVILYAVVTAEITQLNYGIFNSVLGILYQPILSVNLKLSLPFSVAAGIAALLLSAFCYYAAYKHFLPQIREENWYSLMILAPALLILFVEGYISFSVYGNTVSSEMVNAGHGIIFVIQFFGIASLFCILYAYKKMAEGFRLNMEMALLEQEAHSLRRYVDEAKSRYEKTKSFRHDIKNHITVVGELLRAAKLEDALHYVSDMENLADDMSFPCCTNNPVADILIGNKLGIAKNDGIDVFCSLHLPYPCPVSDIDFGIILSNALDNAICACRKMDRGADKYIRVAGRMQGDFIFLEVENSFQGTASFSQGTGLANIKAAAEKYHGTMDIRAEASVFSLSVLLIISQHPESISRHSG